MCKVFVSLFDGTFVNVHIAVSTGEAALTQTGVVARRVDAGGSLAAQTRVLGALVDILIALVAAVALGATALVRLQPVDANMLGVLTHHPHTIVDVRLKTTRTGQWGRS